MAEQKSHTTLIILRHSPYGSSLAKAGVDAALAAGALEQPVELLFLGDGVLQLIAKQNAHILGAKDIARQLSSLPLFDIATVYVDAQSIDRYQLDLSLSPVPAKALGNDELHTFISRFDHVLSL
ncbi:MAG: tRNA 2-thiouridine synthesizing protein C [Halioglobus sp.]|jgi:tRNA 2-thiouridine synthesizing protein C